MECMSPTIGNLAAALAQAQQELAPVARNASNPAFHSRYADLSSCIAACRAILPKYKLSVSQVIEPAPEGQVCVATILMHESGEWLSSRCTLHAEGGRGVNPAQAAGSAITYARRYGFAAIVGLATDDDDANASGMPAAYRESRAKYPAGNAYRTAAGGRLAGEEARSGAVAAAGRGPCRQSAQKPAKTPGAAGSSKAGAEAQPAPLRPGMPSWQMKALTVRLAQRGMDTREKCLADLSAILGRSVRSSKELTALDFSTFMKKAPAPSEASAQQSSAGGTTCGAPVTARVIAASGKSTAAA